MAAVAEGELGYEQVVADQERRDHRARGDIERFVSESAHDKRDRCGVEGGFDCLTIAAFFTGCGESTPESGDRLQPHTDAIATAEQEEVRVKIVSATIGEAKGRDGPIASDRAYLLIRLVVQNLSRRRFRYRSWNEGGFGFGANLKDGAGNYYSRSQFGIGILGSPEIPTNIKPRHQIADLLCFAVPGEDAKFLELTLRNENPPLVFRFKFPVSSIKNGHER